MKIDGDDIALTAGEESNMQKNIEVDAGPASTSRQKLIDWPGFDAFREEPQLGHHRLCELDLFNDDVLRELLDKYPRNRLQAWTMGTDPTRREDWKAVDTAGLSGKDLLAAVKSGRIWYNILRLD